MFVTNFDMFVINYSRDYYYTLIMFKRWVCALLRIVTMCLSV